jgi:hypothetical protein
MKLSLKQRKNWVLGSAVSSLVLFSASPSHAAYTTPSGDKSEWEAVKSSFPKKDQAPAAASLTDLEKLRKEVLALQNKVNRQESRIQALESSDSARAAAIATLQSSLVTQIARIDELEELEDSVLSLEEKTQYLTLTQVGGYPEMRITGANLRLINGMSCSPSDSLSDLCSNGVGNLTLGYNGITNAASGITQTGSHNLVISPAGSHTGNSSILGGYLSGSYGFSAHSLSGERSRVYSSSVVIAGSYNTATNSSAVLGGSNHSAAGSYSTVSGGQYNVSQGDYSSVSGGRTRDVYGIYDWAAGVLFQTQ